MVGSINTDIDKSSLTRWVSHFTFATLAHVERVLHHHGNDDTDEDKGGQCADAQSQAVPAGHLRAQLEGPSAVHNVRPTPGGRKDELV